MTTKHKYGVICAAMLFAAACGAAGEDELAIDEDEVRSPPGGGVVIVEMPLGDGGVGAADGGSSNQPCATLAGVTVTEALRTFTSVQYRVRATGATPGSTIRFDKCIYDGRTVPQCQSFENAPGWSLVTRVPATVGPRGHASATVLHTVDTDAGAYVYFRAKEARGSADGQECPYTYAPFAPL